MATNLMEIHWGIANEKGRLPNWSLDILHHSRHLKMDWMKPWEHITHLLTVYWGYRACLQRFGRWECGAYCDSLREVYCASKNIGGCGRNTLNIWIYCRVHGSRIAMQRAQLTEVVDCSVFISLIGATDILVF